MHFVLTGRLGVVIYIITIHLLSSYVLWPNDTINRLELKLPSLNHKFRMFKSEIDSIHAPHAPLGRARVYVEPFVAIYIIF